MNETMLKRKVYDVNGHILSTLTSGAEGQPVAVFLHGIPASAELWGDLLAEVGNQGYFCVAPDCPGYGYSTILTKKEYSVKGAARLLIRWIKKEGWSNVWLIGHDIGGGIAQLMVTEEEQLFSKLTLANTVTAANWPVAPVRLMKLFAHLHLYPFLARLGLVRLLGSPGLKKGFFDAKKLTKEVRNTVFFDNKIKTREGRQKFAVMLRQLSPRDTKKNMKLLSSVKIPVHLIWGVDDPFLPWSKSGQILEKAFKRVKVTRLKKAGHFLMLDAPERFLAALLSKTK